MKPLRFFSICILLLVTPPLWAADLFGVQLEQATKDGLRAAIKNAGVNVVSEAGVDKFFDTYEADGLLAGADYLYLGFTKANDQFAFAEYRFKGLDQPEMLRRLKVKYGEPKPGKKQFLTDYRYQWVDGAIEISLYSDWANYATRLVYAHPQRLAELRVERKAFLAASGVQQEFQEPAY